ALAPAWPEGGPPVLWRRPLGEGYSAISVKDGALYTMLRDGEEETVVAISAATGDTLWQLTYDAPTAGWRFDRGAGPHATPAVTAERVFAIGSTAKLHALDRATGAKLWSHDLIADLEGGVRHRGYSSSPLLHQDVVIAVVGGEGGTVVAFRQTDGAVVWRGGSDDSSYSSPLLVEVAPEVLSSASSATDASRRAPSAPARRPSEDSDGLPDGQHQLVVFAATRILGLDPDSGRELWSHPHPTSNAFNISTPLFSADDGILFMSSAYDGGGRAIQLERKGDATEVKELWFSNQVRVHFGTAIRLGDTVYASSGDFGPAPMTAVDVRTGEVLWRDRTFAKHSLLHGDGKTILLDEDGALGLVEVSREGMTVRSRAQVFDSLSWTVPTLVGTKLYLRNREEIMALDLGPAPGAAAGR
ncbi:MAG TPA: PQQ-binding-like beta-propeller repeat protein, partial [Thermoanaerobaculia bacterium]|nr:PQQ-binding-like beta-propeller repeat protein [Thermoanaerobaculia bacterium]